MLHSSFVEIHEATAPRIVSPSDPQVLLPRRCLDPPPPERTGHRRSERASHRRPETKGRGREQRRRRRSPLGKEAA